jgi:DNA-binding transcriptional ArsR family regulator
MAMRSLEESIRPETLRALGPEAKIDVIRGLVRKQVREHPEGINASAVAEALDLSPNTAKKHLDYLVATREIYNRVYSQRNTVYFPNERLSHPYVQSLIELEDQTFRVNLIENERGSFVYIQELQDTPGFGMKVVGGVIIRKDNLAKMVEGVYEVIENEEREKLV